MIVDTVETHTLSDANYMTIQSSRNEAATLCTALEGFARMVAMMQAGAAAQGHEMTQEDGMVKGHARMSHEMAIVVDRYIGVAEKARTPRIIIPGDKETT